MSGGKISLAFAMTGLLGACSTVATTRNLPLEQLPTLAANPTTLVKSSRSLKWHVQDVRVQVPDILVVSEANSLIPNADIVWRGDPYGDRRAQIRDIVDLAASQAVIGLQGPQAVYLDIKIKRFHALSQKARATVGGTHAIFFDVTIRDTVTNMVLVEPVPLEIKLKAFGGQKAIDAEMRGETQKVRISREIASVMRQYLGA